MKSFFEIELKALLTKLDYDRLFKDLPTKYELFNKERVHTRKFHPDIRLRKSNKRSEIVSKEGDPTKICRKEIVIDVKKNDLESFYSLFKNSGLQEDPCWTKDKIELYCEFNGFTYIICLQNIHNFAYILEVEILCEKDDSQLHKENLVQIIKNLGCEPIDPQDFSEKIKEYIKANQVK